MNKSIFALLTLFSLNTLAGGVDPDAFTFAGTWKGKALAVNPSRLGSGGLMTSYSCSDVTATVVAIEGPCEGGYDWQMKGGKAYQITITCNDSYLTPAGREIFAVPSTKSCDKVELNQRVDGTYYDFHTSFIPDSSTAEKELHWVGIRAEVENGKPTLSIERDQHNLVKNSTAIPWQVQWELTK